VNDSTLGLRFFEWLYRSFTLVLPREFRRLHGEDTVRLFRDLYRAEHARAGMWGVATLFSRSLVQLLICGIRERLGGASTPRHLGHPLPPPTRRVADAVEQIARDLSFAVRSHAKRPAFAFTVVLIVAVGVGATTTIFSVVDGVLLRSLPYPAPERLYFFDHGAHSPLDLNDFRDRTTAFSEMAGGWDHELDLTGAGEPLKLSAALITHGFFEMLGAQPLLGRLFTADEFTGEARAVVIDHGLWQRRFGSDDSVVGRTITLAGQPVTVVGVMSPRFESPSVLVGSDVDVWLPFDLATPEYQGRGYHVLSIAARLKDGVTRQIAQGQLDVLAQEMFQELPVERSYRDGTMVPIEILPLYEVTVGAVDDTLYMLLGSVGLMLLLACANLANLFLARGTDRSREIALRAALGAGRTRIVSQLLTETVFLSLIGGALGVAIAYVGVAAFGSFDPGGIPRAGTVAVDVRVLAFALVVSAGTGVLFGIMPALMAASTDVNETLKDGSSSTTARRARASLRSALVVLEIATALVLLSGAGLLFNSFLRLKRVDVGFDTEQIVTLPLTLGSTFDHDERVQFTHDLLERLTATPGVDDASAGVLLPFVMSGRSRCCWRTRVYPVPAREGEEGIRTLVHPIAPGYFRLLGAKLLRGRGFADDAGSEAEAVINASLARRVFGDTDVVGRTFRLGDDELTVVGLVDQIRHWGAAQDVDDQLYVSYARYGGGFEWLHVAVKTELHAAAVAQSLRSAVWALRPSLPVGEMTTMRQRVADSVAQPRFYTLLLTGFAAVAIVLAAGGIYGSMLYSVGQRQRELGIRMAVGAQAHQVLGLIVGHGMVLTVVGIGAGLLGALALSRVLESMLFGIATTDPATYASVSALLATTALAACYLPARQASRTDPIATLKSE
jgi:putative ABC transport system permease protein